ncbi:hypothetical protein JHK84_043000 [Glycine max]|nr:hypothetical protein JHK84_043000 [Glycine max]
MSALVLSTLGKRIDQAGKKKYVKQRGDVGTVRQILEDVDSQIIGTLSGDGDEDDLNVEITKVHACVVDEENELGETPLFTTTEKGHLDVVELVLERDDLLL